MANCPDDWNEITLAFVIQAQLQQPGFCAACDCPLKLDGVLIANMEYRPSLAGNVFFAVIFGIFLVVHLALGVRYRTRGFAISMVFGLILETIGYIARVLMRQHIFDFNYFVIYLVCLTIGPAFFAAAIYLSLSRIVVIYAPERARLRPQFYTYIFITCDAIALVLQATGGGITSTAKPNSVSQRGGIDTMLAGVTWQVVSLVLFGLLALDYWLRIVRRKSHSHSMNPSFEKLRNHRVFQPYFLVALSLAAVFIFVRFVFRCVELSDGFDSPLANNEATFMTLEGLVVMLACGGLTFFHPGLVMGAERWSAASWKGGPRVCEPMVQLSDR